MRNEQEIQEIREDLKSYLKDLVDKYPRPANETILDDVDFRELLKISRRTTLNYRNSGKLKSYKIENKIFYFLSDIIEFIKKNGVPYETK